MNALVLTVLVLGGADAPAAYGGGEYYSAMPAEPCEACAEGGRHGHRGGLLHAYCGPMPQSCYNPSFGCYPSTRFMHRYPAFHNYYYREAYNYRHDFDYPWHAGLHEPTSMFSYHVPAGAAPQAVPPPAPTPVPDAAYQRGSGELQSASRLNSALVPRATR
jgi:hypothetical protein